MTWLGLEDRGVVVTGAAGGIGRAVAEAFAAEGARVCAVDVRDAAVEQVVAGLDSPDRHLAAGVDLGDLSAHEPLLKRALEAFGRFDVLAHLAAVLRRRDTIDDVTEEDWDVQLDINLKATFFLNRAASRLFRTQGNGGRIVKIIDVQAVAGIKGELHLIGEAIAAIDLLAHHVTHFRRRQIDQQGAAAAEQEVRTPLLLFPRVGPGVELLGAGLFRRVEVTPPPLRHLDHQIEGAARAALDRAVGQADGVDLEDGQRLPVVHLPEDRRRGVRPQSQAEFSGGGG